MYVVLALFITPKEVREDGDWMELNNKGGWRGIGRMLFQRRNNLALL